jgi:hypothetical protein
MTETAYEGAANALAAYEAAIEGGEDPILINQQDAPHLAAMLQALIAEHERTLEGLYAAYCALGEDTDGARNARELFGPMTHIGNPAEYVARLVREYRAEMEAEVERADAALNATPITIAHDGGNTVTGTLDQVLNHGHLKAGWKYVPNQTDRSAT